MSNKSVFIIWLLSALMFAGIFYAAYKFHWLPILGAAIITIFALAIWVHP